MQLQSQIKVRNICTHKQARPYAQIRTSGNESCTEQRWAALGLRWASAGLALGYGKWIYIGYKINVKLIYIGSGIW